jgi:hypothetical protein
MVLHSLCSSFWWVIICLFFIFFSPTFFYNMWEDEPYLSLVKYIILLLIVALPVIYTGSFTEKTAIHFFTKMKTVLQKNPSSGENLEDVIKQYIELAHYSSAYHDYFINRLVNKGILSCKYNSISEYKEFNDRKKLNFSLSSSILFVLLWHVYLDVSIVSRFMFSLVVIIGVPLTSLLKDRLPYLALIKLAKKYNITEWK